MILEIPLKKAPNQTLSVTIENNVYDLELNMRLDELYLSVIKNNQPLVYNRVCQDLNPIRGGFYFNDVEGVSDPKWDGLGDRFKLIWTSDI